MPPEGRKLMQMIIAMTDREIEYFNGVEMEVIPPNTLILVDKEHSVALINGVHVDIFDHEYSTAS